MFGEGARVTWMDLQWTFSANIGSWDLFTSSVSSTWNKTGWVGLLTSSTSCITQTIRGCFLTCGPDASVCTWKVNWKLKRELKRTKPEWEKQKTRFLCHSEAILCFISNSSIHTKTVQHISVYMLGPIPTSHTLPAGSTFTLLSTFE